MLFIIAKPPPKLSTSPLCLLSLFLLEPSQSGLLSPPRARSYSQQHSGINLVTSDGLSSGQLAHVLDPVNEPFSSLRNMFFRLASGAPHSSVQSHLLHGCVTSTLAEGLMLRRALSFNCILKRYMHLNVHCSQYNSQYNRQDMEAT